MKAEVVTNSEGRSEKKRRAILSAARELFLRNGFHGTSMDQVAVAAAVSKQTIYKQFADKEALFRTIVGGVGANSEAILAKIEAAFPDVPAATLEELEARLTAAARTYLDAVLQPQVLSLRRLVIAEVEQFPDLAQAYYITGPERGIDVIVECLRPYATAGMVAAADLRLAATHFAHLALSPAQDRAMFMPGKLPNRQERARMAAAAARAFVGAYGRSPRN